MLNRNYNLKDLVIRVITTINYMKRIDFIKRLTTIAIVGVPILTLANSCSNTEDEPIPGTNTPADKDCLANGTNSSISANHGHTLTVSKDDVQAGAEKLYAIQGSSTHPHTVTISAGQFDTLKSNNSVDVVSSNDSNHSHTVTVSCS